MPRKEAAMDPEAAHELNEAAYRQLKPMIDKTYPHGRFVAIHEGRIVGDAATFAEIDKMLETLGVPRPEGLVTQAGINYPEYGEIIGLRITCVGPAVPADAEEDQPA